MHRRQFITGLLAAPIVSATNLEMTNTLIRRPTGVWVRSTINGVNGLTHGAMTEANFNTLERACKLLWGHGPKMEVTATPYYGKIPPVALAF